MEGGAGARVLLGGVGSWQSRSWERMALQQGGQLVWARQVLKWC